MGCESPIKTRGWCNAHYQRWYKTGDPTKIRPAKWDGYIRPTCASRVEIEQRDETNWTWIEATK